MPAELRTKKRAGSAAANMSDAFTTVAIPFKTLFKGAAAFAVVALVAVPYLAERAVPGDSLYAVKVQFNEEVRSTLTFDSAQRVEWETERLNRRIAEARLLASEGRLTEDVEAEVADAVRTHSQNAKKEIEVLRALDADEATIASIALESTLEVQATAFNKEQENAREAEAESAGGAEVGNSTDLIAVAVNESRGQNDSMGTSTAPSYEKLMAKVEQNTTRIYELRNSIAPLVSETRLNDVSRRIEDTERAVLAAIEARQEDDNDARARLIEVLQRTQKLIVFMTEIEVSETLDIEDLVPVVLTPEEQTAQINDYQAEITAKQATVRALLENTEDESLTDLLEKLDTAMLEVDRIRAALSTATEYETRVTLATGALALVDDALVTLEANGITTAGTDIETEATNSATSTEEAVDPAEEASATSSEPTETVTEPEPVEVTEPAPEPEPNNATATGSVATETDAGIETQVDLEVSTSAVDTPR